jgi:hypothetical protein
MSVKVCIHLFSCFPIASHAKELLLTNELSLVSCDYLLEKEDTRQSSRVLHTIISFIAVTVSGWFSRNRIAFPERLMPSQHKAEELHPDATVLWHDGTAPLHDAAPLLHDAMTLQYDGTNPRQHATVLRHDSMVPKPFLNELPLFNNILIKIRIV